MAGSWTGGCLPLGDCLRPKADKLFSGIFSLIGLPMPYRSDASVSTSEKTATQSY